MRLLLPGWARGPLASSIPIDTDFVVEVFWEFSDVLGRSRIFALSIETCETHVAYVCRRRIDQRKAKAAELPGLDPVHLVNAMALDDLMLIHVYADHLDDRSFIGFAPNEEMAAGDLQAAAAAVILRLEDKGL